MPVIKSAKKKLRADKKRTLRNKGVKNVLKELIKKAKATKSEKAVSLAVKAIDKGVKTHVIHKNKASRLKSSLSKLLPRKESSSTSKKTVEKKKTVTKKPSVKTPKKAKK